MRVPNDLTARTHNTMIPDFNEHRFYDTEWDAGTRVTLDLADIHLMYCMSANTFRQQQEWLDRWERDHDPDRDFGAYGSKASLVYWDNTQRDGLQRAQWHLLDLMHKLVRASNHKSIVQSIYVQSDDAGVNDNDNSY